MEGSAAAESELTAFARELLGASEAAFRVARASGLSPDDAADAVQEASIKAWRHRSARRNEFQPWFLAIVHREARRRRRPWLTIPLLWQPRHGDIPDVTRSDAVSAALWALPPRQRIAIALRYQADLSIADVARVMHIRETAAKQLLARARTNLRTTLTESSEGVQA